MTQLYHHKDSKNIIRYKKPMSTNHSGMTWNVTVLLKCCDFQMMVTDGPRSWRMFWNFAISTGTEKEKKYATQRKTYSYLDLPKGADWFLKRSLKGFNSPYFLGLIGTPWKVLVKRMFHQFLLSTGVRYLVFFHHFHLNSASCWWDSYWTLHPRGSRPSPHNVVRCAELSTLTNWNAFFPHFHRSLTLACQPHASSQYSHRIIQSISKQLTSSTLFSGWTSFYAKNSSTYIDYSS